MQTSRRRWRADRGARAIKRLAQIEASIAALEDEDLLDLADIFKGENATPIHDLTTIELTRRHIGL